jgi:hypothetical protein
MYMCADVCACEHVCLRTRGYVYAYGMRGNMSVEMCVDMCIEKQVRMLIDTRIDLRMDMCVDMRIDMCVDMCSVYVQCAWALICDRKWQPITLDT